MSRPVVRFAVVALASAGLLSVALAFSEWSPLARRAPADTGIATPARNGPLAVAGYAASVALPGGARLHARLAPLHADPEQQAFDARALAARFALPDGAPYRLELALEAGASPARVRAAELRVHDDAGLALAPLFEPAPRSPAGSLPADPLRALLAPADVEIASERAVSVCLWGRAPAGRVLVRGLANGELELAAASWEVDGLGDVLARVPMDEHAPGNERPARVGGAAKGER